MPPAPGAPVEGLAGRLFLKAPPLLATLMALVAMSYNFSTYALLEWHEGKERELGTVNFQTYQANTMDFHGTEV